MKRSPGFTMIEILMVVGIILVIMAFLAPKFARWIGKSDETKISLKFISLKDALIQYKMDLGDFPTQREGLKALIENPRSNDDSFRHKGRWPYVDGGDEAIGHGGVDFIYNRPPAKNKGTYKYFEIIYPGPSGDENDPAAQSTGV